MERTRKILVILLCALMILGVAGCGATGTQGGAPSQSTASSQEATPASTQEATPAQSSGEKVNITYACWGTIEENKAVQDALDKFNASQDKTKVELKLIPWEGYVASLNTMAAANNLPDTANMQEPMVMDWVKQGMLADISDMYAGSDSKPLDCITYKADGKPVAYGVAAETVVMYYNKSMFDKAGVAYPPSTLDKAWTWDEFVANAKKLTLDKNGKHPDEAGFDAQNITQYGCLVENLAWQLEWPILSNGGGFYSADGSKVTIGDPAATEAIQKVADLYLKDHVAPLSIGSTDDGVQRGLIAGTVAMTTNGTWNVGTCLNTAKEQGLNYGIAVLPKMKQSATLATAGTNVVFNQSKHQKEAIEWIKWYANIDNGWPLISAGIWPPIFENYYTDETLTHKWLDNPNFPPYADYKAAAVDPMLDKNYVHSASWFYVNHAADFNNLLTSILGDVWSGKATAQDVITKNLDKFNAIFNGTAN